MAVLASWITPTWKASLGVVEAWGIFLLDSVLGSIFLHRALQSLAALREKAYSIWDHICGSLIVRCTVGTSVFLRVLLAAWVRAFVMVTTSGWLPWFWNLLLDLYLTSEKMPEWWMVNFSSGKNTSPIITNHLICIHWISCLFEESPILMVKSQLLMLKARLSFMGNLMNFGRITL